MSSAYYCRQRKAAIDAGTWLPRVPAALVQQHIDQLQAADMTLQEIADAADVSKTTVIAVRHQQHVQGPTAAAILDVKPRPAAVRPIPAGLVSLAAASERVRALVAAGWSLAELSRRSGVSHRRLLDVAGRRRRHIMQKTHDRLCVLFEDLAGTSGPSQRARDFAARNGWLPPCPDEEIDEVLVEKVLAGERAERLNDRELIAVVQIGAGQRGMPLTALGELLSLRYSHVKLLQAGQLPPARAKRAAKRLVAA